MTDLLLYTAVPFNYPADSIAARRGRKAVPGVGVTLEQQVMLQVAAEAAQAIHFLLGPGHRPRPTPASPAYTNPELKSCRCPPNTPTAKTSFDFSATDADVESSDDDEEEKGDKRNEDSSRKRRRLVSFSDSAAGSRRVPHKKLTDDKSGRKILTRKKPASRAVGGRDLTDGAVMPRLNFFAEVQAAAGVDDHEVVEQRWRNLGKSLRAIADRFAGSSKAKTSSAKKVNMDALPNGVWSAVISYVLWKILKGLK